MARNQVSRREESDNSKGGSKDGPDDEDDDGKYNLRKRTRKENPYYYEFSDDDKQENVGRKRMKKFEDEYDPNEEENSNQKYMNKQQNQPNMSMGNMMDQNALSTQMMMQQMASRNQQMMNMPNLNESSGALNQMMGGYNQAQMSPQNYMVNLILSNIISNKNSKFLKRLNLEEDQSKKVRVECDLTVKSQNHHQNYWLKF